MEYVKDRLNQRIRELERENSVLRESLYQKDRHLMKVKTIYEEAESINKLLIGALVVMLVVSFGGFLYVSSILQEMGR